MTLDSVFHCIRVKVFSLMELIMKTKIGLFLDDSRLRGVLHHLRVMRSPFGNYSHFSGCNSSLISIRSETGSGWILEELETFRKLTSQTDVKLSDHFIIILHFLIITHHLIDLF